MKQNEVYSTKPFISILKQHLCTFNNTKFSKMHVYLSKEGKWNGGTYVKHN